MSSTQDKALVPLDRDSLFIDALLETGGNIRASAAIAGFNKDYGYALYKRLAKQIAEAAQEYLALHSVKAARKVIDTMEADVPNPIHLAAANSILDRAGVIKKDFTVQEAVTVKANIFILPEKRELKAIDAEYERA